MDQLNFTDIKAWSFQLDNSPKSVQFTIHLNNLLNTFDRVTVLNIFRDFLNEQMYWPIDDKHVIETRFGVHYLDTQIGNFIEHYGLEFCQYWFTTIYGWEFTQKAG